MFFNASNANPDTDNWDLSSLGSVMALYNIFRSTAISTTNYSNFLNMAAATATISNVDLGLVLAEYNAGAVTSRDYLVNNLFWTIIDSGQE